jgi:hypothetical protein
MKNTGDSNNRDFTIGKQSVEPVATYQWLSNSVTGGDYGREPERAPSKITEQIPFRVSVEVAGNTADSLIPSFSPPRSLPASPPEAKKPRLTYE